MIAAAYKKIAGEDYIVINDCNHITLLSIPKAECLILALSTAYNKYRDSTGDKGDGMK